MIARTEDMNPISIEDWLKSQRIEKFDAELIDKLREKGFWILRALHKMGAPLDQLILENPKAYDISQGRSLIYDTRVEFLLWFNVFLANFRGIDVVEGGCGTTLDSAYLASKHSHNFRAYDWNPRMINYSKKRMQPNLELYVSEHASPKENEIGSGDVVFERASLGMDIYEFPYAFDVLGLRQRVKPGGYLIIGSGMHGEKEVLDGILGATRMKHVESKLLISIPEIDDGFSALVYKADASVGEKQ